MKKVFFISLCILFVSGILVFFLVGPKDNHEEKVAPLPSERKEKKIGPAPKIVEKVKIEKKVEEKVESPSQEDVLEKQGDIQEFELSSQYYPSLGGYLKVEGNDIQILEVFYRETNTFIISLGFTKVINSIFQVEQSFWNLHKGPDGLSYNLRIGNGPLSGNVITFTEKSEKQEEDPVDEEQINDSNESQAYE